MGWITGKYQTDPSDPGDVRPRRALIVVFRVAAWALTAVAALTGAARSDDGAVSFNQQVRPILAEHCLSCHGPDARNRESDFRLDLREAAVADLGGHAGIVPGQPDQSVMLQRIVAADPDERMPPPDAGRALNAQEISLLKNWIAAGARYESHWAFAPVERPDVPGAGDQSVTEIDRFLQARLSSEGLSYSPAVTRRELIRRATFDLLGLPPTPEEVDQFVSDESPDAFERVIDRLLESPRYGERWGRHWLDLARYADTHGGGAIGFTRFPFSYTYRDYVVRAFNHDVPYNRFVMEQIAADQLQLPENDESLAALGFLTVGRQFRNPHDIVDDRIDVVTRGLLGLTVACARCHDHKYDAIPTEDYYSLYATLGSSEPPELLPIVGVPESTPAYQQYQQQLADRRQARDDMRRDQNTVMRGRLRMQVGLYLRELARGVPEQDLASVFLSYRTDDLRPLVLDRWRKYLATVPDTDPVFGLWQRLTALPAEDFQVQAAKMIETMSAENGDDWKSPDQKSLRSKAPRWNPRVLETMRAARPASILAVADAYGELFASVHTGWLQAQLNTAAEARPGAQVVPDEDERHREVNSAVNRELRRHLYGPGSPTVLSEDEAQRLLNRPIRDTVRGLETAIDQLHLNSPGSPPRAMALVENPRPDPFRVFVRGNPIARGELVEARFLTALSDGPSVRFEDGQRRLGLARAIVDPRNPLTRRVIVNWVWQHHFGQGLVRTPDDFGVRGEPPTHPRLLDYLASVFLDDGWSLKALHRRIMLTDAYRQASRESRSARLVDPDNRLLWRMPRRRLDAESMRDAMLAVSGALDESMGGRPFELMSTPLIPRRSVYGFVNRDVVSAFASTFDMADPSACTAKRPQTTVPQQTLFALNSGFIHELAKRFAERPDLVAAGSDEQRVQRMYQLAFARLPDPDELQVALRYIQQPAQPGSTTTAWERLAHVLLASNEFVFVD